MSHTSSGYQIEYIGEEKEPVVIVDNFSDQHEELILRATKTSFLPAGVGYPGIRAAADPNYLMHQRELLSEIMQKVFAFKHGVTCESCSYSMVTTQRHDLMPAQRIPHYDDTSEGLLAVLHYISAPETGGTSFYRHRRSGFETITPDRVTAYRKAVHQDDLEYGPPERGYIYGDSLRYEMITEIPAQTNRLIIYRGRTLHSGVIPNSLELTDDPLRGRLTVNTFLANTH